MITTNFNKKTGHKLLQGIVDEIFGKGAATVDRAPLNKVTTQLQSADAIEFVKFLKARLGRLKEFTEGTSIYMKVLKTLELMGYPEIGEMEYAKLAAWEILEPWFCLNYATMILPTGKKYPEETMLDTFASIAPNDESGVIVMVNSPWSCNEKDVMNDTDYFSDIAHRMFYECDEDVSEHVIGIVVINEDWNRGCCTCHAYWNSNSLDACDELQKKALKDVVNYGDEVGEFCEVENVRCGM